MVQYIIRLPNPDDPEDFRYLHWSTIVDAPTSYGMTREELEAFTLEWDGKNGLERLAERLERADRYGISAQPPGSTTWQDETACNYAGPDDSALSHRGLWQRYVIDRPGPGRV